MLKLFGKDASHKSMERVMKEIDKDGGGEVVRRTAPSNAAVRLLLTDRRRC